MYEVVVIGAGVAGSSAAYHLAKEVEKSSVKGDVLLIEQFSLLHTKGSSHGESRIIRRAYDEPYYVHMMDESFSLWEQIERESGNKIYTQTGILVFGEEDVMKNTIASLEANSVEFEILTGDTANNRWPSQLQLPSSYTCVLEKDGGILSPRKALSAFQTLFVKHGGIVWDNCPVTDIIPGDTVRIITSKGEVLAKNVILTVGPWAQKWANKLNLQHLSFKTMRAEVFYWKAENPEFFEASKFPVFIAQLRKNKHYVYGLPTLEYPGVIKVANSLGPVIATPEERDDDPTTDFRDEVSDFIGQHLKGVSTEVETYEACIVTYTSTQDPILDCHPSYDNIILGMGLSGHGFKLSPVIGKILCKLAMGERPSYDLSPFKVYKN